MGQAQLNTTIDPPLDVFEKKSAETQKGQETASSGEILESVIYPDDGGMLVNYYDRAYPLKGHPWKPAVDGLLGVKKYIVSTVHFIKKHYILTSLFFLLPPPVRDYYIRSVLDSYLRYVIDGMLRPYFLEEKRLCTSAREIRRASYKVLEKVSEKWKQYAEMGIIFVVNLFQWDNAYRYRGQDVFGELDKNLFIKNP